MEVQPGSDDYWDAGAAAADRQGHRRADPPTRVWPGPQGGRDPKTEVLVTSEPPTRSPLARPVGFLRRAVGDDPLRVTLLGCLAVLVAALVAAVVLVPTTPSRHWTAGNAAAGRVAPAAPATETDAGRQQASAIEALLVQDEPNRSAASNASQAIANCGDLAAAVAALQQSAAARRGLVDQLGSLAVSALPGGATLVSSLRSAWQDSAASDSSYAQWGRDESNKGCTPNDDTDPNYRAAQATDSEATSAKNEFVSLWNPLAARYGLSTWKATAL